MSPLIERNEEEGTLKVKWQYLPPSEEDCYIVPRSHADALSEEFDTLRDQLAGAVKALEEILALDRAPGFAGDRLGIALRTAGRALDSVRAA